MIKIRTARLNKPCTEAQVMTPSTKRALGLGKLVEKTLPQRRVRTDFQDSVDGERQVTIDYKANPEWKRNQCCWEAKGPIAEAYERLWPLICDELKQSRRESSREVIISLFMVGKKLEKAKPIIIISSEDGRSRKDAKEAIERSTILADTCFELGLLRYPPSGPIRPVAMGDTFASNLPLSSVDYQVYFNPKDHVRFLGMPIYIKHGTASVRKATANAVYNGYSYGYLTAAHAFMSLGPKAQPINDEDYLEMPFDSDSDSSSSGNDGDIEIPSQFSNTSSEATNSEPSFISSEETQLSQSQSLQNNQTHSPYQESFYIHRTESQPDIPKIQKSTDQSLLDAQLRPLGKANSTSKSLDYAIVSVTDPGVISFLEKYRDATPDTNTIAVSKARSTHAFAWTSHGAIHGNLLDIPIMMCLPESDSYELTYKFIYNGAIEMGDCGALVIDAETGELYGHIIADSESEKIHVAYIMAAVQVVEDITSEGNWRLLSTKNAKCEYTRLETYDSINAQREADITAFAPGQYLSPPAPSQADLPAPSISSSDSPWRGSSTTDIASIQSSRTDILQSEWRETTATIMERLYNRTNNSGHGSIYTIDDDNSNPLVNQVKHDVMKKREKVIKQSQIKTLPIHNTTNTSHGYGRYGPIMEPANAMPRMASSPQSILGPKQMEISGLKASSLHTSTEPFSAPQNISEELGEGMHPRPALSTADARRFESGAFNTVPEMEKLIESKKHTLLRKELPRSINLQRLKGRDLVFLLDNSASMEPMWKDAKRTFAVLAYLTKDLDPDGLEIVFTSDLKHRYRERHRAPLLKRIDSAVFTGECDIGLALEEIIPDLGSDNPKTLSNRFSFQRHKRKERDAIIYVFTDGVWKDGTEWLKDIQTLIARLIRKDVSQRIHIQFIQFGNDPVGSERLRALDRDLSNDGATVDLIDTEPFTGNVYKMLLGSIDFDHDQTETPQLPSSMAITM